MPELRAAAAVLVRLAVLEAPGDLDTFAVVGTGGNARPVLGPVLGPGCSLLLSECSCRRGVLSSADGPGFDDGDGAAELGWGSLLLGTNGDDELLACMLIFPGFM